MRRKLLASLFLGAVSLFLGSGTAKAVCPVIPFVFSQGSVWNASQVNANFTSLYNCASSPTSMPFVLNTAALQALAANAYPFVQREYNVTSTDGGSIWYWDGASTCAPDGGLTCVRPGSAPPTGRWRLDSWSANGLDLNPGGAAGSVSIYPSNAISTAFSYQTTATGTVTSTPTDTASMALVWMKQEGALKGLGLNHQIALFEGDYVDTTSLNNDDTYNGVVGNCNMTTPKGVGTLTGTSCVGVTAAARAWAPQGGILGTEYGGVHGLNIVSGLSDFGTTPTHYNNVIGAEADLIGCTGCTMKTRWGFGAIDFGDGFAQTTPTEKGSSIDAAFVVGSLAGPGYGWKYGMDFAGQPVYGGNSLTATGIVLGSSNSVPTVAGKGIDLSNFVISGNAFAGPGNTFRVDGAGNIVGQSITVASLVGTLGLVMDAPLNTPAVEQWRTAGVVRWQMIREATTETLTIHNDIASTVDFRISTAGVVSLGNAGSLTVNATGGVNMPGVGVAVGAPTGGLKGAGTINIGVAAYINGTIGVTCGPGATTAAHQVVGGITIAC